MVDIEHWRDNEVLAAEQEINGVSYLAVIYTFEYNPRRRTVIIFTAPAEQVSEAPGDKVELSNETPYSEFHRSNQKRKYDTLEEHVSKALNEAVCQYEAKEKDKAELERRVAAALEANEEVHQDIDHQLERN